MKNLLGKYKYIFLSIFLLLTITGVGILAQPKLEFKVETDILKEVGAFNTEKFARLAKMAGNSDISREFSTENVVNTTENWEDYGGYGAEGRIFEIFEPITVETTSVDAGYGVNKFKKMYYAHAGNAFSELRSLYPGDVVKITEGGITRQYMIEVREVYEKATRLDGTENSRFRSDIYNARHEGVKYSISLMTCGTGEGSIDSNYRLVFFANEM